MASQVRQRSGKIAIALLMFLFIACSPGSPLQPISAPHPRSRVPVLHPALQGLYESCSPDKGSVCLTRLQQMADAGFKLVINYDQFYGTADQQLVYAKQAHMLGMKIIWSMSDPAFWDGTNLLNYYPDLATTCACSDNNGFISYMINLVKALPATWGYYVGDEVKEQDHDRVKALADLVKRLDLSHPRLFVSDADGTVLGANLTPFVDTAEVVGMDIYPISNSAKSISSVGKVAHTIQSIANRYHKSPIIVLQAFSWAEYPHDDWTCSPFPGCARFPTEDEMQQMRTLAVANAHLQFILWYSFFDILRSTDPSAHLAALTNAASCVSHIPQH